MISRLYGIPTNRVLPLAMGFKPAIEWPQIQTPEESLADSIIVRLRGIVRREDKTPIKKNTTVGTLPTDRRPPKDLCFVVAGGDESIGRIYINARTGALIEGMAMVYDHVFLDGVQFFVAPLPANFIQLNPAFRPATEWPTIQYPAVSVLGERVFLRGLAKTVDGSIVKKGGIVGVIPANLRPPKDVCFIVAGGDESIGRVYVNAKLGTLNVGMPMAYNHIFLDGIQFFKAHTPAGATLPWKPVPLTTGFRPATEWPHIQTPEYYITDNIVYMRGLVKKADGTPIKKNTVIGVLPPEARPPKDLAFVVAGGGESVGRIYLNWKTGTITVGVPMVYDHTFLDGIRFSTSPVVAPAIVPTIAPPPTSALTVEVPTAKALTVEVPVEPLPEVITKETMIPTQITYHREGYPTKKLVCPSRTVCKPLAGPISLEMLLALGILGLVAYTRD